MNKLEQKVNRSHLIENLLNLKYLTNLTKDEKEKLRQKYISFLYWFEAQENSNNHGEYDVEYYYFDTIPVKYKITQYVSGGYNISFVDLINKKII